MPDFPRPSEEDLRLLVAAMSDAARGDLRAGRELPRDRPLLAAFQAVAERSAAALDGARRLLAAAGDGELERRLPVDGVEGELLDLARSANGAMERLAAVAAAVTGLAREVGEGGRLGGRASVPEAAGAWRVLVDEVNGLAALFAGEVRGLSQLTIAVARGELPDSLEVAGHGEVRALNETINAMLTRLRDLASEVVRLGREVGGARPAAPGRLEGVSGIWKDLTENMSAAEQSAVVARYRSELLASMSHELRTPLNSLLVLAKLLSDNREANLTAKQVEYARTIHGSGGDLLSLVNDILDLATMEAGRMRVQTTRVELDDVAAGLERSFRPVAEEKGLGFAVEVIAGAPRRIETDPRRLQQILRNLLANALKFTHAGRVAVRIGPTPAGVAFAIEDTGIGIEPASQTIIFEPFRQADGMPAHKYGGTGLGLSISRSMAELLGGTLQVDSAPGRGSTFTLILPLRLEPLTLPIGAAAASPSPPPLTGTRLLRGRKVLVIDDDMRNVFTLAGALEHHGAEVLFAEHHADGLAMLERHPDVSAVLVAASLMDGDSVGAMRALPGLTALPVLAVRKPVDAKALLDLLMVAPAAP